MIIRILFMLVFLLSSIRLGYAGSNVGKDEKNTILHLHNVIRESFGLESLLWDDKIANSAQEWANTLAKKNIFQHSQSKNRGGRGENIYMIWGDNSLGLATDGTDAVNSWTDEGYDYDISSNTCTPGKVCGHYTQVIWKSTRKIGCGKAVKKSKTTTKIYWVCQYDPPGNIIGKSPL